MKSNIVLISALAVAFSGHALAQSASAVKPNTAPVASQTPASQQPFQPNAVITQGFDGSTVTTSGCALTAPMVTQGWFARNNSLPLGASCWNVLANSPVPNPAPQAGDGYIVSNFNNTTGANPISSWLVTPRVNFGTGARLEFWTRAAGTFPDRLEVRLSTAADTGTPDVGTSPTDVGTFTTLLLTINEPLSAANAACPAADFTAAGGTIAGYPNSAWCRIVITGAALPTSGSGRIAFRNNVADGGPDGNNSNIIRIDSFSFDEGVVGTPGLSLAKRVQTSSNAANCPSAGTTLSVPPGTQVYYCYQATNTGTLALQTHNLTDTAFGTPILTDLQFPLAAGASSPWVVSPAVTITQQTSSAATWSACAQATNCTGAPPTASATSTVAAGVVTGFALQAVDTLGNGAKFLFMLVLLGIGLAAVRRLR